MNCSIFQNRSVVAIGVLFFTLLSCSSSFAQIKKDLPPETFRTKAVSLNFDFRMIKSGARVKRSVSRTVTVACSLENPRIVFVGKVRRQGQFRGVPLRKAIRSLKKTVRAARKSSGLQVASRRDERNWAMYKALQQISPCEGGDSDRIPQIDLTPPDAGSSLAKFKEQSSSEINEGESATFIVELEDEGSSALFDFGDGNTQILGTSSNVYTVSHRYADDGIYTVSFRAELNGEDVRSATTLRVNNQAPRASIDPVESSLINTPISFAATATDEGADRLTYQWDFGDGTQKAGEFPTHTYTESGVFQVSLTVSDDDGGATEEAIEVAVNHYGVGADCEIELPEGTRRIYVSNVEELDSAAQDLEPGDALVLRAGTYNFSEEIFRIPSRSSGTAENRVYLIAERPGTVTFTGNRIWYLFARYLTISGITFRTSGGTMRMRADHQRFTCNLISQSKGGLGLYASHLEVDNNIWEETEGINLWAAQPGIDCTNCHYLQFHHIHHNTWRNIERTLANGGEPMMLGYGYWTLPPSYDDSMYATVEWNYFENANGDGEVISIKSDSNLITNNCFNQNGLSEITIRMGSKNVISNNQSWGLKNSAVRISGQENIISGNFFQSINGGNAAIDFHNGGADALGVYGAYTYIYARDNIIEDNILNNFRFLARDYAVIGPHFMGYSDNNTFSRNQFYINSNDMFQLQTDRTEEEFQRSLNFIDNEFLSEPAPAPFQPCYTQVYEGVDKDL